MAITSCPTTDQLIELIDGVLSVDQTALLQSHVDGCGACQQNLEGLVAGTASWDDAVNHLRERSDSVHETILAAAIDQMKSDPHVSVAAPGIRSNEPLDYLAPSDRPDSIGRLGNYEVSEVIGQGGMGVVLKAFDPSLHRVVAVKILAPYLAHNPQARRRFIREAKAIAAVSHDHVITIHAIDESIEQPKIVMQYVPGRSLQQKLDAEGSLELREILRIGMQTAAGLAAAHAQGLVHRDVKPSNILLENSIQRVKLTDFGLARAEDDASITQSGVISGTPQYMAPEQANGDLVDYRADLFSLGSVLYAMCVGHSPFRASTTMGVLKRVCHDPPRPIRGLNPDIPEWLCQIIMKLLAKKPEDRFPTAKSVAELLEQCLASVQQPQLASSPLKGFSVADRIGSSLTGFFPPAHLAREAGNRPTQAIIDQALEVERVDALARFRRKTGLILVLSLIIGLVMTSIWVLMGRGFANSNQNIGLGLLLGLIAFLPIWVVRFLHAWSLGLLSKRRWARRGLDAGEFRRTTISLCLMSVVGGPVLMNGLYAINRPLFGYDTILSVSMAGACVGLYAAFVILVIRYLQYRLYEQPVTRLGPSVEEIAGVDLQTPESHETSSAAVGDVASNFQSPMMQFRPISWLWLGVCLLFGGVSGMLIAVVKGTTVGSSSIGQEFVEGILVGGCIGFGAFLLITLFRLTYTEIREALFFAVQGPTFPAVPILKAKSLEVIAWGKASVKSAASLGNRLTKSLYTVFTKSFEPEGRRELKRDSAEFAQTVYRRLRSTSRSTTTFWLTAGWCLAGAVDLLQLISNLGKYIVWDILGFVATAVSFILAHGIHVGENPDVLRKLCLIALWPFSLGVLFRVPLAIVSWSWLRIPSVKASFAQLAWSDSKLGRPVAVYIQPLIRNARQVGVRSIVTIGLLALWTFAAYWILFGAFLMQVAPAWNSFYIIKDYSNVSLRDDPQAGFTMIVAGRGSTQGLMPVAESCPLQEIVFSRQAEGPQPNLKLKLGEFPLNMATGAQLTELDIENFFLTLFGKTYSDEAASLFQSIHRLNREERNRRSSTTSPLTVDRWNFFKQYFNPTNVNHGNSFVGYSSAAQALDPRRFNAAPNPKRSYFGCDLSTGSVFKATTFAVVFWLFGVVAILLIRQRQRVGAQIRDQQFATESNDHGI